MKIIDFEKKGHLVRFYLGDDDCNDYHGDDFNDVPYDCNAGQVYEEYVKAVQDIVFPFDCLVLEPADSFSMGGCGYSKDDMIKRRVPCIIVVPEEVQGWTSDFNYYVGSDGIVKFYFEDKMNPCGGIKIWNGDKGL